MTLPSLTPAKPTAAPDGETPMPASPLNRAKRIQTGKSRLVPEAPMQSLFLLRTHTLAALFQYRMRFRNPEHSL